MSKIAILGGAFDPPHLAHIAIAENAVKELGYDKVIFLPSYNPPHKQLTAKSCDRLNMIKLAIEGYDKFEICDIEIYSDKIGYTVDTLPRLKAIYGDDIHYIIGGDSMRDFHTWSQPLEILKQTHLIVAMRDNDEKAVKVAIENLKEQQMRGIKILDYRPQSMSSSQIRLLAQLGMDCTDYLSKSVYEYIMSNNIYSELSWYRNKLKLNLEEERYQHSLRTVICASKIAKNIKLDINKVLMSALLHDCAKYKNIDYSQYPIPQDSLNTPVAHAFAGKYVAKEQYGIEDEEILNAIYYHTTAKAEMSALEGVIYCADMLESERDFDGIESIRNIIRYDFWTGLAMCVVKSYEFVSKKTNSVYPLTVQAYEYYINYLNKIINKY